MNFNTLLSRSKDQQQVIIEERKLFKERLELQKDQWVAEVRNLEDEVSMLKSKVIDAQHDRNLAHRKMDLMLSMKQRESCLLKLKLEYAESDIEDFREYVDYLIRKLSAQIEKSGGDCSNRNKGKRGTESNHMGTASEKERSSKIIDSELEKLKHDYEIEKAGGVCSKCNKGKGGTVSNHMGTATEKERSSKILDSELEKLKRDYEILLSRNDPDVPGLLEDRDFAWSQFEKMRSDYTSSQKSQRVELEQANEKIEKLMTGMGQLESSNSEKDEIIVKLKAELAKFEVDTDESNKEISRLSKEKAKLRNSKAASLAPVLNSCTTRSQTRGVEKQKASVERSNTSQVRSPVLNKESPGPQASDINMNKKPEATKMRCRRRDAEEEMPKPARREVMSKSNQEHSVDLGVSSTAPTNIEDEQVDEAAPTQEETIVPSKGHKRVKTSDAQQKTPQTPLPSAEKKDSADSDGRCRRSNGKKWRCKKDVVLVRNTANITCTGPGSIEESL